MPRDARCLRHVDGRSASGLMFDLWLRNVVDHSVDLYLLHNSDPWNLLVGSYLPFDGFTFEITKRSPHSVQTLIPAISSPRDSPQYMQCSGLNQFSPSRKCTPCESEAAINAVPRTTINPRATVYRVLRFIRHGDGTRTHTGGVTDTPRPLGLAAIQGTAFAIFCNPTHAPPLTVRPSIFSPSAGRAT
jgi:hypothetical protein